MLPVLISAVGRTPWSLRPLAGCEQSVRWSGITPGLEPGIPRHEILLALAEILMTLAEGLLTS
jgi:hypothetical protein